MARPFSEQVLSGETTATVSPATKTNGHNSLGMFIKLNSVDSANDTVDASLEVSPVESGDVWATPRDMTGNTATTTVSDADANDGVLLYVHGCPAARARIELTSVNDAASGDLTVDGWLLFANNSGRGYGNRQR